MDHEDRIQRLSDLVTRLRSPTGCPWDREQRLEDVRAYLLEEAHEVAAAIDERDWHELEGELGDLLFQLVFVARLAEEAEAFTLSQVIDRVEGKMIARHPHVFGDQKLPDSRAVRQAWERRKLEDRQERDSVLLGVPSSLPALLGAYRMTQKAAGVGFDWPDARAVLDKVEEELSELRAEFPAEGREPAAEAIREELGDLLFTLANLCRHLGVDPEAAAAEANAKFKRRFRRLEEVCSELGSSIAGASLEEMERLWNEIKSNEKGGPGA